MIVNEIELGNQKYKILQNFINNNTWQQTVDQHITIMCQKLNTKKYPQATDYKYYQSFLLNFLQSKSLFKNTKSISMKRGNMLPVKFRKHFFAQHSERLLKNFKQGQYVKILQQAA